MPTLKLLVPLEVANGNLTLMVLEARPTENTSLVTAPPPPREPRLGWAQLLTLVVGICTRSDAATAKERLVSVLHTKRTLEAAGCEVALSVQLAKPPYRTDAGCARTSPLHTDPNAERACSSAGGQRLTPGGGPE